MFSKSKEKNRPCKTSIIYGQNRLLRNNHIHVNVRKASKKSSGRVHCIRNFTKSEDRFETAKIRVPPKIRSSRQNKMKKKTKVLQEIKKKWKLLIE